MSDFYQCSKCGEVEEFDDDPNFDCDIFCGACRYRMVWEKIEEGEEK